MGWYTVQWTIPTADNTVANYATNTWHFEAEDLTALGQAQTAVQALYNNMRGLWSNQVRQNNHYWKAYSDLDPEPRAPVLEGSWNLPTAPTGTGYPPEVALCLSFQGSRVSGVPQSRKRGRIYFPFLLASAGGTDGRPTSTTVSALASSGQTLLTASDAAAGWSWIVYSKVAPGYSTVTDGWVDNEWDTQRRRGRPPTSRTVFT